MIITKYKQLYPMQYGFGVKYRRDIRGGSILRKIGKFIFHKILKPMWKNNKDDIIKASVHGVKRLVQRPKLADLKTEILKPIIQKINVKKV